MNIMILGASGFIGSAIATKLLQASLHTADYHMSGLARDTTRAAVRMPQLRWLRADLAQMSQIQDWLPVLTGQDIIINCAGALQDGLTDDLTATQETSMLALYQAAKQLDIKRIVQISAPKSDSHTDLPFLTTKQHADTALSQSGIPYVILRPGLVLARNAHGGSALLRALAALPWAVPLIYPDNPVSTVALDDVATVVLQAVEGKIASGSDLSISNDRPQTLQELVELHRQWLGLSPARIFTLPAWLAQPVISLADLAGRLGWRSPLRSTAMSVMRSGILPDKTRALKLKVPLVSTAQTLLQAPSGVQDLWFARLYFIKPAIIVCLSLFWILSGLMPLFAFTAAQNHFATHMPGWLAGLITFSACIADIGLGLLLLYRPYSRRALGLMLALSLIYLLFASLSTPSLWFDPLGSLVKILPAIVLTLTAMAILDER